MTKVILAFDNNDADLGDYFEESFTVLNANLSIVNGISIIPIRGLDCSEENIITNALTADNKPFIFIGLSHGNEQQLLTENEVYVDVENLFHFKYSLFYTPACSTAVVLGKKLIEIGCSSFVGCNMDTWATYEDFNSIYIECENYCITEFLNSNCTIQEAFNNMLVFFDNQIDSLYDKSNDDILLAMELQHNKDSFVLYGNKSLRSTDFDI